MNKFLQLHESAWAYFCEEQRARERNLGTEAIVNGSEKVRKACDVTIAFAN